VSSQLTVKQTTSMLFFCVLLILLCSEFKRQDVTSVSSYVH